MYDLFSFLQNPGDLRHILIAAPGKIDDHDLFFSQAGGEFHPIGDCVGTFDRGDHSFQLGKFQERLDRFRIGDGDVFGPAAVFVKGVLRTDPGIIKTGRNRIDRQRFALSVLDKITFKAVEDSRPPFGESRRVVGRIQAFTRRFHTHHFDSRIIIKWGEKCAGGNEKR
jgi:hypothetical protein